MTEWPVGNEIAEKIISFGNEITQFCQDCGLRLRHNRRLPVANLECQQMGKAMVTRCVLPSALLIALAAPSNAQQATTKEQLIGSWRVLSLKAITGNNVSYPLGEKVAGYLTNTSDRITVLLVDTTRKAPAAAALTDAESIAMMKSHGAWTGKYATAEQTADGIKLTVRVDAASNEAINNTDRVYFMRVNGNKLTIKSPGVTIPTTASTV